jgi:hypothetical protein
VATALTVSGLSGVHASYLAHGGYDFLIGDGRLTYAPEYVWESYYNARLFQGFFAGIDVQHVANPAYNQARGPVWSGSVRFHLELGLHREPLPNGPRGYPGSVADQIFVPLNAPLTAEFIMFSASFKVA